MIWETEYTERWLKNDKGENESIPHKHMEEIRVQVCEPANK